MNRREFWRIINLTFHNWQTNNASVRAAALAFFTILPLPSLLLIAVAVLSLINGQQRAIQELVLQIYAVAGPAVAELVAQLLQSEQNSFTSFFDTLVSVIFALVGAIGVFAVLQDSLNAIWEVQHSRNRSIMVMIRERLSPFLLVSAMSLIVIFWTGFTTVLSTFGSSVLEPFLGTAVMLLTGAVQIFFSFVLAAILFAIVYKELPDTQIAWTDVIAAAIVTSFIFTVLNYLFGIYIRTFPVTTLAGVAGSLIVLLLWIFVTYEFVLFGAQLSKTYAETKGSRSHREQTRRSLQ